MVGSVLAWLLTGYSISAIFHSHFECIEVGVLTVDTLTFLM